MLKDKSAKILAEIKSYSKAEKLFILFTMICSFCITCDFATIKPVAYSVFISYFSAAYFPYCWLLTLPLNFLIVTLYNKFLPRLGCYKMCACVAMSIVSINVLGVALLKNSSLFTFFYFMWKDIYIMLMFQQLWSIIHATISKEKAKYLYGIIFGVGGLGSVVGSCIAGFYATSLGSENLLFITAFLYGIFIYSYDQLLKSRAQFKDQQLEPLQLSKQESKGGFALIYRSRYLKFILLIVVFMQVASTLLDFQFNSFLQQLFADKDQRTAYAGQIFSVVHAINICFQFFGTFLIVHWVGFKRSHFFIPLIFASQALSVLIVPSFALITLSFGMIKACDYSIFNILKEMLYLPLSVDEKFKAKAVIDVFAYRSSRALASLAILGVGWLGFPALSLSISWILLLIFIFWMLAVFFILRKEPAYI